MTIQQSQQDDKIISSQELKEDLKNVPDKKRFSFGHELMDKYLHEIAEGDFIVIGGTAGSGKTAWCVSLTHNLAHQNINALWFSIELSPQEFIKRFGDDLPLFYVPRKIKEPTMTWLENRIDEAIRTHNIKVVFIDHLGMIMDEDAVRNKSGLEIFDERLKRIKMWAVDKDVSIIGISTVKQETAEKKNKQEFTYADFRGTAMIGHTADLVLMIRRKQGARSEVVLNEILDQDSLPFSTEAEIHILKCRRSGIMKAKIHIIMDGNGIFREQ